MRTSETKVTLAIASDAAIVQQASLQHSWRSCFVAVYDEFSTPEELSRRPESMHFLHVHIRHAR